MSSGVALSVNDLARLHGVSEQAIRKALARCVAGQTWRGISLDPVQIVGRGGRSGWRYAVRLDSLPPELQARYWELNGGKPPAVEPVVIEPPADWISDIGKKCVHFGERERQRLRLAAEVFETTMPRSRERAEKIAEAAARERIPARTLRSWVRAYEQHGANGIARKARADQRRDRATISRAADQAARAAGVNAERWQEIRDDLALRVAACYADHLEASANEVALDLVHPFMELCRKAGIDLPERELRHICRLPRQFVEQQKHFQGLAIYNRDKGRWSAEMRPRVKRDWSGLPPMGCVVMDVWHMDILIRRDDGTLATPKAVIALDMATRRTFLRIFLMPKGKMIRREHVLQTLLGMFADPDWGIPNVLYIDNGSEFRIDWVMDALNGLSVHQHCEILRAAPYNPQSKPVEGYIAILKRYLARFVGYIGGDRFRKKTENLGREPQGFPGTFAEFDALFQTYVIPGYHCTPQRGHLDGATPNQRFSQFLQAEIPWRSRHMDEDYARLRLATQHEVRILAGGSFTFDNNSYICKAASARTGDGKLLICKPLFGDRSALPVFCGRKFFGIAELQHGRDWRDPAGISERESRGREQRRQHREMNDHLAPVLRLGNRAKAHDPVQHAIPVSIVQFDPEWRRAMQAVRSVQAARSIEAEELAADPLDREAAGRLRAYGSRACAAGGGAACT